MPADGTRAPHEPSTGADWHGAWRVWWIDLGRVLALAAASLCIGLTVNHFHRPVLSWNYRPPATRLVAAVLALKPPGADKEGGLASSAPSVGSISLEEFQALAGSGKGRVIDARARAFYEQGHVPGALNLPRETFAADYPRLQSQLEAGRSGGIVVYCSEADCPDAETVAEALGRLGYEHPHVYREGWEEWSRAGLPQEPPTLP